MSKNIWRTVWLVNIVRKLLTSNVKYKYVKLHWREGGFKVCNADSCVFEISNLEIEMPSDQYHGDKWDFMCGAHSIGKLHLKIEHQPVFLDTVSLHLLIHRYVLDKTFLFDPQK